MQQQPNKEYFLEVQLPGKQGKGTIIIKDVDALKCFLESIYKGNSYFQEGSKLTIYAMIEGVKDPIGSGTYKIKKNVLTFEINTEDEFGIFERNSIIVQTWQKMKEERNIVYHMMVHNIMPSPHITQPL
jgi:hypothetical protein